MFNSVGPAGGALHIQTTAAAKTARRVKQSGLDRAVRFINSQRPRLLAQDLHRIKPHSGLAWRKEGLAEASPPAEAIQFCRAR